MLFTVKQSPPQTFDNITFNIEKQLIRVACRFAMLKQRHGTESIMELGSFRHFQNWQKNSGCLNISSWFIMSWHFSLITNNWMYCGLKNFSAAYLKIDTASYKTLGRKGNYDKMLVSAYELLGRMFWKEW